MTTATTRQDSLALITGKPAAKFATRAAQVAAEAKAGVWWDNGAHAATKPNRCMTSKAGTVAEPVFGSSRVRALTASECVVRGLPVGPGNF